MGKKRKKASEIKRCRCGHGDGAHSHTSDGGGCRACCCGLGQVMLSVMRERIAP